MPQQLKSSNPNSSSWLTAPQPLTTTSDHCQVNYGQLACNANCVCLQYIVWLTAFVVYLNYCGCWHTVLGSFWNRASCENSHAGTTHIMETKLGRGGFLGVEDSSHSGHPIFTCMWHTNRKFKLFSSQYGHWTLRLGNAAIYWVIQVQRPWHVLFIEWQPADIVLQDLVKAHCCRICWGSCQRLLLYRPLIMLPPKPWVDFSLKKKKNPSIIWAHFIPCRTVCRRKDTTSTDCRHETIYVIQMHKPPTPHAGFLR